MNLVDSCGWLEFLADGPNARFFAGPLTDTKDLLVPRGAESPQAS